MKTSPQPNSKPVCWWWVRHAPVPEEHRKFIYGNKDVPADTSDRTAFAALARVLPEDPLCVTSPLGRTKQTLAAIEEARRASGGSAFQPAAEEPDFIEQSFGDWQGQDRSEMYARLRDDPKGNRFWLTPADEAPPGGESFAAVAARVAATIERLSEAHPGRHILSAGHGGPIRAALGLALGVAPDQMLRFQVENLSVTRIDRFPADGAPLWRVTMANAMPATESWGVYP